jgi:beta-carotene 3-hydroxylase
MEDPKQDTQMEIEAEKSPLLEKNYIPQVLSQKMEEKMKRKKSERFTYLIAAVMSSLGITSMAVLAVYYRFSWQMEVKCWEKSLIFYFIFIYLFMYIVF